MKTTTMKKVKKTFRFNEYIDNCVKDASDKLKITSTLFYEIAVIEKLAKLDISSSETQFLINYIDNIIKNLEMAKNKLNKGN